MEAQDWDGSWNTRHNKHAKNTCHGHAKEALAIALNFLKLFWSAVVRQEIEGDFVTTISPVCWQMPRNPISILWAVWTLTEGWQMTDAKESKSHYAENSKHCTVAESGLWRGDPGAGGVPADPAGAQHQVPAWENPQNCRFLANFLPFLPEILATVHKISHEPLQDPHILTENK